TSSSSTPTVTVAVCYATDGCSGTLLALHSFPTRRSSDLKTLVASYAGDGTFAGSTSTGVGHTVNPAATTTAITGQTPNPSTVGRSEEHTSAVQSGAEVVWSPMRADTVSDGTQSRSGTVAT